jgi:hypothetical protein
MGSEVISKRIVTQRANRKTFPEALLARLFAYLKREKRKTFGFGICFTCVFVG